MMQTVTQSGAGMSGASAVHMNIFGLMPVVVFGTDEQKARMLPPLIAGKERACFAVTEPNTGLDTTRLRTRAERRGDRYVVHGQKVWISTAQVAEKVLLLARTTPVEQVRKRTEGLSLFYTTLDRSRVEVREIDKMGRKAVDSNQLFFDGLEIPVEDRIGAEGEGWPALKAIIGNERLLNADVGRTTALLRRLRAIASVEPGGLEGQPLMRDPHFRRRLARLEIALHAVEATALRFMRDPTLAAKPETALLKIRGTELQQDVARLLSETVALYGLPQNRDFLHGVPGAEPIGPEYAAALTPFHLFWRKASISAGTNEVMRDLVAAALLD